MAATVYFLMGPTAAGKSALALELAQRLGGEIVNVDSALVYRGMVIGTAAPDEEACGRVPHHLVGVRDPAEPYSVAEFSRDVKTVVADVVARGRVPLLVGGTMLYFRTLKTGIADMPSGDEAVRERIRELGRSEGWGAVRERLRRVDPSAAERIPAGDRQRLLRALEVFELSGTPLSTFQEGIHGAPLEGWRICEIGLVPRDRSVLYDRIESRFHRMLEEGFVDEVRALRERGDLHADLPAMKAVGYRQIWQYLDGELDREAMVEHAIVATRRLAKRQLTWLRKWEGLQVIDSESPARLAQVLKIIESDTILGG